MFNYKDKKMNVRQSNENMFNKSLGMFEYEGLPETLPSIEIEKRLQRNGFVFIYEVNKLPYAFSGGFSGELDVYGHHQQINIDNNYLNFHKTVNIEDGILIKNDDFMTGLVPIYDKYNTILNENEITMMMNNFNNRMQQFISAGDDKTKASADKFIDDIIKGELGVIAENQIFDGIKAHSQNTSGVSSLDLIEFQQYMKASLYNEIGIDLNFNMKRERLTSGEVQQNSDILFPLVNAMYRNRLLGIEELNLKLGLSVEVIYGSIWKEREIMEEEETEEIEEETEEIEETDETEETEEELHLRVKEEEEKKRGDKVD